MSMFKRIKIKRVLTAAMLVASWGLPTNTVYAASGLDTPPGSTSLPFSIQGATAMTLTQAGLGIGTGSPTAPLQVFSPSTLASIQLSGYGNGVDYSGMGFSNINSSSLWWISHCYAPSDSFGIFYYNGSSWSQPMTILASGNVGIGTTVPQVGLDVAGAVRPGSSTNVTACDSGQASGEGSLRYDYTAHQMEFCNGTTWVSMSGGSFAVTGQYTIHVASGAPIGPFSLSGLGNQAQDLGLHQFCAAAGENGGSVAAGQQYVFPTGSPNGNNQYDWKAYNYPGGQYWSPDFYVVCFN